MKRLLLVVVALTLAESAAAQEQRASIEGTIRDSSGAVMPGVAVDAQPGDGWRAVDDD
jgi:hypothetical protein